MRYLIDSNVVIDYLAFRLKGDTLVHINHIVDMAFLISVITKIEVLGFKPDSSKLDIQTEQFIELAVVFDLSPEIVDRTIQIRKNHKIKIADAIIAATAIKNDLTLLTNNIKDFKGINGLKIVNPYAL